jgi:hypothetical protein
MITNALSQAIASVRHQAVDGELLESAGVTAAVSKAVHARFEPGFDGAVDLPYLPAQTAFDRLAQSSRGVLESPTWLRENLAPMEVAVKQLLREVAGVQNRESRLNEGQKRRDDQAGSVDGNLRRAAEALAAMRSVIPDP